MSKTLEIINGISQVLSMKYDCAHDSDGNPIKMGLNREVDNPSIQSRMMDGFSARFHGDKMILSYQADCKLKTLHNKDFESDVDSRMGDIVKFLKKEYKKVTGKSLALKPLGEVEILAQYLSRVRTTYTAQKMYEIGGEPQRGQDDAKDASKDRLDDTFKKFLELSKDDRSVGSKGDNYKQFDPFNLETGQRNPNLK